MPPSALIFDFGNVLATFDYGRAMTRLGAPLGWTGDQVRHRLEECDFGHHLRQYESGQTTAFAFSQVIAEALGTRITPAEFARAWADIFDRNTSIEPLLNELKQAGYPLILGSNTNDIHADHFRRQFPGSLGFFDALILSYEVGHSKPAPEFYQACVAAAGHPPSQCLFIDDLAENVAGACRAGLQGVVYTDTPTLRRDLAALGIDLTVS